MTVEIIAVGDRHNDLMTVFLDVWESSVRETHNFLAEDDIVCLRPQVRQALTDIEVLFCTADDSGQIFGFMGTTGDKIEMLFIRPDKRGCGIGRQFIDFAVNTQRISSVDVNEQNIQALEFYKYIGFLVVGRSPQDGQGRPFPILHMAWGQRG